MTNVIQLVPRTADQPQPSVHDLLAHALHQNAALAAHVMALTQHVDAQSQRIADLESHVSPPRFEPHAGRLTPKQAAFASGFSLPTIHRWFRSGAIEGKRHGVRIFIDPDTLPMRK
jgi:hypothetical protein